MALDILDVGQVKSEGIRTNAVDKKAGLATRLIYISSKAYFEAASVISSV